MISADVIKAPPGLGKTTLAVQYIAQKRQGTTEFYVPTHRLADEIENLFRKANPNLGVRVIRGREHVGPNGKTMCAKAQTAAEVARSGLDVYKSMCEQTRGQRVEQCAHFAACPYIQQFAGDFDVNIYTHPYLSKQRTKLEPPIPDLVVIDESFWQSCVEITHVPAGLLHAQFLKQARMARAEKVCAAVYDALTRGLPLFDFLHGSGVSSRDIHEARMRLRSGRGVLKPGMGDPQLRAAARALRDQIPSQTPHGLPLARVPCISSRQSCDYAGPLERTRCWSICCLLSAVSMMRRTARPFPFW